MSDVCQIGYDLLYFSSKENVMNFQFRQTRISITGQLHCARNYVLSNLGF